MFIRSNRMRVSGLFHPLVLVAVASVLPLGALAQDMDFDFDEGDVAEPDLTPPVAGEPTAEFTAALQLYESSKFEQAAIALQNVVDGETGDDEGNVQKAQFFLAKTLYSLRFYQTALAIFDEITRASLGHLYFDETLQWLAQLATQLPEPAGITDRIGRYPLARLETFNTPENAELYNHLVYLMGRYLYGDGDFETAVEFFQKVGPSSPFYVEAKFFEGITYVRLRRARPAVAAFRTILDAANEGKAAITDKDRIRNLAWISLARVYYTSANRVDPETGDTDINGQILGQAIESWNQVDQGSEYWLDALFESSWAFFIANDHSRSLGNVHSLNSPFFSGAYYPEASVIKAVTFFVNCQYGNALATIGKFHDRYDPIATKLEETMAQYEDNVAFFDFLLKVRSGEADLPESIRGIVKSSLSDRTVLGHVEYVRVLEEESKRLDAMSSEFQDSMVGSRILADIEIARSFAIDQTGDLTRGRYNRLVNDLQDLAVQIDTVELEILTAQREGLSTEAKAATEIAATGQGEVIVDEEHQLWPFDGEYWRDELGFYRQRVTHQCGR
jgi:tetratricopeptide (TPR) repeat protein